MTKDQKDRIDNACHKYRYCSIVHGPLHNKQNEQRVQSLLDSKKVLEHEIIRITVELSYLFWNPIDPKDVKPFV